MTTLALIAYMAWCFSVVAGAWWLQHCSLMRRIERDRARAYERWLRQQCAPLCFGEAVAPANDVTLNREPRIARKRAA